MNDQKIRRKKHSWKFWTIFWVIAVLFLAGWYIYLQIHYKNIQNLKPFIKVAPVGSEKKAELTVLSDIYQNIGGLDKEKTFLVLFQNDLELRPGGGFIGAFGILKMKNGKMENIQVFDTGVFDGRIPNTETPPAPLAQFTGVKAWKMRDSNWSPDFETNARKAEYFYTLGGGQENFDGVIGINTRTLNSVLAVTGPVKLADYPGEYRDENAILQLEYQVEKGYAEQGITKVERKYIMGELADALKQKIESLSLAQQLALAKKMDEHLKQKDIQLYFANGELQKEIENIGWSGRVKDYSGNYLMAVDANLLSLKSDYCIKRKMDYSVDSQGNDSQAVLNITYEHTCRAKDWMTSDYRDWLRVYVPKGSFLETAQGQDNDVQYSEELGKKVFGMKIFVPVGQTKTITLKYRLPKETDVDLKKLLIQKQSGIGELPFQVSMKKADGSETNASETLLSDKEFSFQ